MPKSNKSRVTAQSEVVRLSSAREKYNYKALLRGYEEVFDSKLRKELEDSHQTEVMFGSALSGAMDFYTTVNQDRGWSNATPAEIAKMERLCKRLDRMLQEYAPFFVRQKILDVGMRILNQEFMGQPAKEEAQDMTPPTSLKEFKARRAGGMH